MTPDELLSGFFGFGATQWQNEPDLDLVPEPVRWIMKNPGSWFAPRATQPPPSTQKVVLYLGEAGTGKTTQLSFDARRLAASSAATLVFRLDFSHAVLVTSPLSTFAERFWDHVAGQIEPVVEKANLRTAYIAARYRDFMKRRAGRNLSALRDVYGYNGKRDFSKMSDVELAGCEEIRVAISEYEESTGDGSLCLAAAQSIASHRTILIVDNVDHLGMEKVELVMEMLTGSIERDTEAYIAVRPEHYHLLKAFRQSRPVTVVKLEIEKDLVFKIAETRCKGAEEYARENGVDLHPVQVYARRMTDLCAAIKGDEHAVTLLNEWHNGDLRQMLFFLSQTSWSTFNRDSQASVRSVLYRNLVRSSLPTALMQVFDPTPHPCKGWTHPFAFPRLRVLAYLAHHQAREKPVALARIRGDFEEFFGLPGRVVDDALAELSVTPPTSGALLRLTDEGEKSHVVFLPAGAVFMSHIVFSCDFLSWLYDQSTLDSLPRVEVDPLNYRQVKLDKAAHILAHKILRVFEVEHPYMQTGRRATPADAKRLRNYEAMFGYRPGRWFLDLLLRELREYARIRGLDDDVLKASRIQVDSATRKLDAVYDHPGL